MGVLDSNIHIAVIGATGSGKTTFVNLVSGSNFRVGDGRGNCTNAVQTAGPFEVDGRSISLIDTPGIDHYAENEIDILMLIFRFLETSYGSGKTLGGIIYMHRISDHRIGGIPARNFKAIRILCGESRNTLKNVVIVTNMWNQVSPLIGEARERELITDIMFYKQVLDDGAQLTRHNNTRESAQAILKLLILNGLKDVHSDIYQPPDSERLYVDHALTKLFKSRRQTMEHLEEDIKMAYEQQDETIGKKLEALRERLEEAYESHRQGLISLL